jgi:hypothetical protein
MRRRHTVHVDLVAATQAPTVATEVPALARVRRAADTFDPWRTVSDSFRWC